MSISSCFDSCKSPELSLLGVMCRFLPSCSQTHFRCFKIIVSIVFVLSFSELTHKLLSLKNSSKCIISYFDHTVSNFFCHVFSLTYCFNHGRYET
jgi:hypothetical protein